MEADLHQSNVLRSGRAPAGRRWRRRGEGGAGALRARVTGTARLHHTHPSRRWGWQFRGQHQTLQSIATPALHLLLYSRRIRTGSSEVPSAVVRSIATDGLLPVPALCMSRISQKGPISSQTLFSQMPWVMKEALGNDFSMPSPQGERLGMDSTGRQLSGSFCRGLFFSIQ